MPRKGCRFRRDPLHDVAVTDNSVNSVVNKGLAGYVKFFSQHFSGIGHADCVRETLPQGAGSCFHSGSMAEFGVPRGFTVKLPEVFYVIKAEVISGHVQHGVKEHGAVSR